jgi:hypothetical protein
MLDRTVEQDAAAELLERCWFATLSAADSQRRECEALQAVMELAEASCRRARMRLARLESVRDALGDELATLHGACGESRSEKQRMIALG